MLSKMHVAVMYHIKLDLLKVSSELKMIEDFQSSPLTAFCAQVLAAGGSAQYCATAMTPGGTTSFLVDVTPGANHSIVQEQTAIPRVVSSLPSKSLWKADWAYTVWHVVSFSQTWWDGPCGTDARIQHLC